MKRALVIGLVGGLLFLIAPSFLSSYYLGLVTKMLIFALFAMSLDLLLGYTGLPSLGHAAYFGLGAYTVALLALKVAVKNLWIGSLASLASVLVLALGFVPLTLRARGDYVLMITLALSQVLWSLAFKFFWVTGGTDGIRVPRNSITLLAGLVDFKGSGAYQKFVYAYYYYVLALFVVAAVVMWVIVHSPFGKALQAIRDNETRASFVGIRVRRYRWIAFVISGFFTGLAGALWVPLNGLTTPEILYWPFSGEIVFMTVLGGFRTFTGPIVGAIAFNYLKVYAVASSQYWQLVLGCVLVVLVMALPTGIVGTLARLAGKPRRD